MKNDIEKRYSLELRTDEERTISGTAIVFNSESELINGQFREVIHPEQVTPELIQKSNIKMLWNHQSDDIPLARRNKGKGSLNINITPTGVDFSFQAKKTAKGDEVLQAVRNGDVDSCSFAFIVSDGGSYFEKRDDGSYLRHITKIELLDDFSLVNSPAYLQTSCRSFDEYLESEVIEEPNPVTESTEDRNQSEIMNYYTSYDELIAQLKK